MQAAEDSGQFSYVPPVNTEDAPESPVAHDVGQTMVSTSVQIIT